MVCFLILRRVLKLGFKGEFQPVWMLFCETIDSLLQDTFPVTDLFMWVYEIIPICLLCYIRNLHFRGNPQAIVLSLPLCHPSHFSELCHPFSWGALKQGRLGSPFLVKFPVQVVLVSDWKASSGTSLQADDAHLFPISLPVLTFALFAWLCPSLISKWELKDRSGAQCSKRLTLRTTQQ